MHPTQRSLLAIIRKEFKHIHGTITKIGAKEKVPYKNIAIDYEHLLTLEKKEIEKFIPEGLDEEANVRELLNGIEDKTSSEGTQKQQKLIVNRSSITDEKNSLLTRRALIVMFSVALLSGVLIVLKIMIPGIPLMLVVSIILIMFIGAMATVMPWYTTTTVIIATILLATLVGAFVARKGAPISEKSFERMIENTLDKITFLSSEKSKKK